MQQQGNTFTIVIATGGMDPVHAGHIRYLMASRALGNMLVVGLNSDDWLTRKKGKPFMRWSERAEIVRAFSCVDAVWRFDDSDGSACSIIEEVCDMYSDSGDEIQIIFANGGDRTADNIPEQNRSYSKPVKFVFGVGGDEKVQSSSTLLKNWETPTS